MTNTDIKASYLAGNSDWEILATLVQDGYEYPDAERRVAVALKLDAEQVDEMRDAYDNNC
jgi:hypothetical protein